MWYQMIFNILQRAWIYQTLLAAALIISISPSVSAKKSDNDNSIAFENVSALLGPYTRAASGEGLGGIA